MAGHIGILRHSYNSVLLIYAFMHLPYRQLEGYLRALSGFVPGLKSADYTALWERIRKEDLNIPLPDKDIVVAADSTGIKVTNRGDWIRKKHGVKRRGWIKVRLAVDVETRKPVAFQITDEKTGDHEMVEPLLDVSAGPNLTPRADPILTPLDGSLPHWV